MPAAPPRAPGGAGRQGGAAVLPIRKAALPAA